MKANILVSGLVLATVGAVLVYPSLRGNATSATPPRPIPTVVAPAAAKRVEVVFVLDTTGSMGGLIQAAKEKIWSIASTLAQAQQAPQISMGLVAFAITLVSVLVATISATRVLINPTLCPLAIDCEKECIS